ncbi:DNA-protecting protein DprA [Kineobactrum sediminis]|uniref:DNA-protecting protein DprA n=1 Tax=Kineobactrum sediminis TaxID=1905677 RepID=A0A2N5Y7N7_9GAMM|nr:DNA-processing protein DprA [Kineobactrum sediminis]PLW84395.1 DNA-protecting protein DprA [Kineobactrum sediminis]
MDASHSRLCLLLHSLPSLDRGRLRQLLQHFGSPAALWSADRDCWDKLNPGAAVLADLELARRCGKHPRALRDVDHQLDSLLAVDGWVLALGEPGYPAALAAIPDPPPLLYVRGAAEILQRPQLAVVGSRKASPAGLRSAGSLAAAASRAGLVITSGLALGIDGAAHRGALEADGASVAVMATGVDEIYPRRHRTLALELLERGCLVSEFAPATPALPGHFPARNRIISGLSLGVLVVEAALPSGSLITAGTALEQGREVFALPWFPDHSGGRGCLRLIRDGAVMVETIDDILPELGAAFQLQHELFPVTASLPAVIGLEPAARQVLAQVGFDVVTIQELVQAGDRSVAEILAVLSALEVNGLVSRRGGGYVRR